MKSANIPLAILFLTTAAFSATIYVPDNYATIQGAIDASSNGDTVIVRPGTYYENIDFVGKAIHLNSEVGPMVTTIDGNQADSVVKFQAGEGTDSILEGFTVTNGYAILGGGILCSSTSPTINNNTIFSNEANGNPSGQGGGIYCYNSSPIITENRISENEVFGINYGRGGGIFCESSSPIIRSNTVSGNLTSSSRGYGGGIYCFDSSPLIDCNIIAENKTIGYGYGCCGAGIYCESASPTICNNTIAGNSAEGYSGGSGGGVYLDNCSSVLSYNNIVNNSAFAVLGAGLGGGLHCVNFNATINNNNITDNIANGAGGGIVFVSSTSARTVNNIVARNFSEVGGGIYHYGSSSNHINDTISENTAIQFGGGICCTWDSNTTISNTILNNNNAPEGREIWVGVDSYSSTLTISYSDVDGGQSSCYVDTGSALNWGAGMIDADPLFADTSVDDFHLTWQSPCRDAGDNSVVTELYDFEGDPRIALGTVDMGADEYYYHLYHMGDVIPGSSISLRAVGYPNAPVLLAYSPGIQDPPLSTQHGDLWLQWPPLWQGNIGLVPGNGILVLPTTVPSGWSTGEEHYLQSLIGPWNGPYTRLSNLLTLEVE